ncbi:hypothetical protein [Mycobacterium shimoidei]|uniref:hypothetical protein n=1 Tax=Mycobacterium shimoidei TaxID=29313 RepID=UPI0008485FA1|nr:hypothetical protein [Mycobacterium shimoidei]MCV7261335.1 hypothetical protein [Mycobacterium shimoidei]ODR06753.1 hypothetical protein BHQ16_21615 [Mycobacterium shimoidei]ORW83167.1 hypothetical protein AWC26_03090 [Mycobacterium shimoidei]
MPGTGPVVSRRRVLAGGAALAGLGITAAACGTRPGQQPQPDPLLEELTLAQHDSELAAAAASAEPPAVAAALKQVAAERAEHAKALAIEIDRVAGTATSTSSSATATPGGTAQATRAPGPPPALPDVVKSLRASATSARRQASTLSGYRAGLLGSIAASCTAAYTVGLMLGDNAP